MKKIITIISITLVLFSGLVKAQTYNGNYKQILTQHSKDGFKTKDVSDYRPGLIQVTTKSIIIDQTAYNVLKTDNIELADEKYYTKVLTVYSQGKTGSYKVINCVLLLNPDKTIAEVIFKKSKGTTISYIIN